VVNVGRSLASQGLYNQVKDGCIVVSIESSKYLNKQLVLHHSSGFLDFCYLHCSYIPFYNSVQSQGHDSNRVPQLYDVYFILRYSTELS